MKKGLFFVFISFLFLLADSVNVYDARNLFSGSYPTNIKGSPYTYIETTSGEANNYESRWIFTLGSGDIFVTMRNIRASGSGNFNIYARIFRGEGWPDNNRGLEDYLLATFTSTDTASYIFNDKDWVSKKPFSKFLILLNEESSQQNRLAISIHHTIRN